VRKGQFSSVQEVSSELSVLSGELSIPSFSIHIVSDDWMADRTQVHADLMRPAGLDLHFQQGKFPEYLQRSIKA
jgi:hypothetical protein